MLGEVKRKSAEDGEGQRKACATEEEVRAGQHGEAEASQADVLGEQPGEAQANQANVRAGPQGEAQACSEDL